MTYPTDGRMEYRQDPPEAHGYADEQEQYMSMRYQIQALMDHSSPDDILDMMLILANICEYRSVMSAPDLKTMAWHATVKQIMRSALKSLETIPDGPRPDIKLENQCLYWPDFETSH